MCICFAYMHIMYVCVPHAHGSHKKLWAPLELELQMIMNQHVGADN